MYQDHPEGAPEMVPTPQTYEIPASTPYELTITEKGILSDTPIPDEEETPTPPTDTIDDNPPHITYH